MTELLSKHPTVADLNKAYHPYKVDVYASEPVRCVTGTAPSLVLVGKTYGEKVPIQWLMTHLVALSEYSGAKQKITPYQLEKLARKINRKYYYYTLSELMLFFSMAEDGELGRFSWQTFDPIAFMALFDKFEQIRGDILDAERRRAEEEERARWMAEPKVPMPKYLEEKMKRVIASIGHPELVCPTKEQSERQVRLQETKEFYESIKNLSNNEKSERINQFLVHQEQAAQRAQETSAEPDGSGGADTAQGV